MAKEIRIDHSVASPETLGGVNVHVEAEEEILVRPRTRQPAQNRPPRKGAERKSNKPNGRPKK